MHLDKDKYDVGVVVGRFQVHKLSDAHRDIIKRITETHKKVIIIIGVAPTLGTKNNPMDYITRLEMVRDEFPEAIITHVMDTESDSDWDTVVDTAVKSLAPVGSVCLYGGRDSFVEHYHGMYDKMEISSAYYESEGTKIRADLKHEALKSEDFRKGVIYASQNQYPKVYPTVDIAIIRSAVRNSNEVLLGRKTPGGKLRFPGGFVDPTDISHEQAAIREASEEVDAEISKDLEYVCTHRIDDWRYKSSEKIITTLYQTNYTFGTGQPRSEFCETEWVEIDLCLLKVIAESHVPLAESLLRKHEKL